MDDEDRVPDPARHEDDLPGHIGALLGQPATWAQPPAALEHDVLAALRRERDAATTSATTAQTTGDHGPGTAVMALAPTALAPGASGRAELRRTRSGWEVELHVGGLPPAAPGRCYRAWMANAAGELVASGAVRTREGGADTIRWRGVAPHDRLTITVTLQREGDGGPSGGAVVLRGAIGE